MFFLPNVLLRCMYRRFYGGFTFLDFAYGDREFLKFRFFQSWASSCIDTDNSVVVVIQCILFVPKWTRSWV